MNRKPRVPQRYRILNKSGSFNVHRARKATPFAVRDLYHRLIGQSWPRFIAGIFSAYLFVNIVFALAYSAFGPQGLSGFDVNGPGQAGDGLPFLAHAFFFSVQTLATIGYGKITPVGWGPNLLVTLEALIGLLGFAVVTGLVFSRFARPTARVAFSEKAVIHKIDGIPSLLFRMANVRLNQVVQAQVKVTLLIYETTQEGSRYREFYRLELERDESPLFAATWLVVHPITEKSPLYGKSPEQLEAAGAEILVTVSGLDDTLQAPIHARSSYIPTEFGWDEEFEDMIEVTPEGYLNVFLDKINLTRPVSKACKI